jgi:YesN/AraC family two-component response regulator
VNARPLRVVVADDEPAIRTALQELLQEADISVVGVAEDGCRALDLVKQVQPDLVFADIRMPGLDGLELAAAIREICPTTPVIILSAFDDAHLQMEAERIPVAGYLVKGCSSRQIFRAIEDATAPKSS